MDFASFHSLAQIAVGLTGFVGIMVALQRGSGAYPRLVLLTFLQLTLGAAFFALLPDLLANVLSVENLWRCATGSFGLYHLAIFLQHQWRRWKIWRYGPVQAFVTIASVPVIALKLGVGLGYWASHAYTIHYLGLLWLLGVASYAFALLLFGDVDEAREVD